MMLRHQPAQQHPETSMDRRHFVTPTGLVGGAAGRPFDNLMRLLSHIP